MIDDVVIEHKIASSDCRGVVNKPVSFDFLKKTNFGPLEEMFSSISKKNVWRGMHLQIGASASNRIIYCNRGRVKDYLIDLRKNSVTKEKIISLELDCIKNNLVIFVPAGVAHGFLSLEEDTEMVYLTDRKYNPNLDMGVNFKSLPFKSEIETISGLVISSRDENLPSLSEYYMQVKGECINGL